MHTQSRIPKLLENTFDGALMWFSELKCSELLFHPEDDPADIIRIATGEPLFTAGEVKELNFLLNQLEQGIGQDKIIEAAYPIFMTACHIRLDA